MELGWIQLFMGDSGPSWIVLWLMGTYDLVCTGTYVDSGMHDEGKWRWDKKLNILVSIANYRSRVTKGRYVVECAELGLLLLGGGISGYYTDSSLTS